MSQNFLHYLGNPLAQIGLHEFGRFSCSILGKAGGRQFSPVHFAVGVEGDPVHLYSGRGHHIGGQFLLNKAVELCHIQSIFHDHIGHGAFAAAGRINGED